MEQALRQLIREQISTLLTEKTDLEKAEERAEEYYKRYSRTAEELHKCRQFYYQVLNIMMNSPAEDMPDRVIDKLYQLLDESHEKYDLP